MDASASWEGKVRLADADGKPGRYYVTARNERGQTAYLLGPFNQPTYGQSGHARALGAVRKVKRHTVDNYTNGIWWTFGTSRVSLHGAAPVGKLNEVIGRA